MHLDSKILVAGHTGLVGSYLVKALQEAGYINIITCSSSEIDLTKSQETEKYFKKQNPEYVFLVSGYKAGVEEYLKKPVEFFSINALIQMNVLKIAKDIGVKKMVVVGAGCIYPEIENQAITEDCFQTGWVQKATESYGLAKAIGAKLCEYYNKEYNTKFINALLVNIYGVTDEKHMDKASVMPALMSRIKNAIESDLEEITVWGTGQNKREFLHAYDCATALIKIMESNIEEAWINVGSGEAITINQLVETIVKIANYTGRIEHDLSKPEGAKRSVLNSDKLKALGWVPKVSLEDGIKELWNSI